MTDLIEIEFVNRDEELRRIREMCTGQRRASILLIRAPDGMGKSWLLHRAYLEHRHRPAALLLLGQPFLDDTVAFAQALSTQLRGLDWASVEAILSQLGRTYTLTLRHTGAVRPRASLSFGDDAQVAGPVIGGDQINITGLTLPGADDGWARERLVAELTSALTTTLGAIAPESPALILLDGYRQRTFAVEQWLLHSFLPKIRDGTLPGVRVVLAGQDIPQFDRDWRTVVEATELVGLPEPAVREYWVERRQLPESDLPHAIRFSRGHPQLLAQMADNASQPEAVSAA